MEGRAERRILLVGKTGDGKSSSGNTILKKKSFKVMTSPTSLTSKSVAEQKYSKKKYIKVVDTPGFFGTDEIDKHTSADVKNTDGTDLSDDQKRMAESIIECLPGPHAVVIVLRVGRYTKHEMETVEQLTKCFGEDVFKYAVVLFTNGHDLERKTTIEQFVKMNGNLQKLVEKCGGRCHVIDNKHWNFWLFGDRSNRVQVNNLLDTIEKLVRQNEGGHYTNQLLTTVETEIEIEIREISENEGLSNEEAKEQAKKRVCWKITAAGCATGALLGALLGIPVLVGAGAYHSGMSLKDLLHTLSKATIAGAAAGAGLMGAGAMGAGAAGAVGAAEAAAASAAAGIGGIMVGGAGTGVNMGVVALASVEAGTVAASTAAEAGVAAAAAAVGAAGAEAGTAAAGGAVGVGGAVGLGAVAGITAGVVGGVMVATGAVAGGIVGAKAAGEAQSPGEAAEMAKDAVCDGVKKLFCKEKKVYHYKQI